MFVFCCLVFFVVYAFRMCFCFAVWAGRFFFGCLGGGRVFFVAVWAGACSVWAEGVFFCWLFGWGA